MCMGDQATVSQTSIPVLSAVIRRQCSRCIPALYRRINRATFLERTLLTWFGFFPWECVSCRKKRYFRDQGRHRSVRP